MAVENEVRLVMRAKLQHKREKEPLAMSILLNAPWENVKIDFLARWHLVTMC